MENPAIQGGAPKASDVEADSPEHTAPIVIAQRAAPQLVHVELSERRRRSRDTVPVASCSIAEALGTAAPICSLARELLRLGIDPATMLSIWRGRTKCFVDAPVSRWSRLTVKEGQSGPVFAPYEPFSSFRFASQRRESDD